MNFCCEQHGRKISPYSPLPRLQLHFFSWHYRTTLKRKYHLICLSPNAPKPHFNLTSAHSSLTLAHFEKHLEEILLHLPLPRCSKPHFNLTLAHSSLILAHFEKHWKFHLICPSPNAPKHHFNLTLTSLSLTSAHSCPTLAHFEKHQMKILPHPPLPRCSKASGRGRAG